MTDQIIKDILAEREYQRKRWGDTDHLNTPFHWNAYITHYASRHLIGSPANERSKEEYIKDMYKVAALAIAAIESMEKQ